MSGVYDAPGAVPPDGAAPDGAADGPPPINPRLLAGFFLVGLVLAVVLAGWLMSLKPGNRIVVVNAGSTFVDSVTVDPDPAGSDLFLRRWGLIAARDSAWIRLQPGAGDADVKVYRGGRVVADHAVFFGGNTIFEVRVGDAAQLGRYRRLGR
jgi:hypothetical protein